MTSSQKFHEQRIKQINSLNQETSEIKDLAQQEFQDLKSLYISGPSLPAKQQQKLREAFIKNLRDSDSLISNMNKYLCFSIENKRFFNVSF
mmetsp:Transcript_24313/g.24233  ORF Transcript_24313/g.24233 Transcript_24313/m.24233 type:complete len:91 (+) Transcript_24313:1244-1516(+)